MDNQKKFSYPERNPKTHAEHRREVFWQIILPMLIGILLIFAAIGAVIFSATQPVTDLERWADVSLMWIILPSLLFAFIFLVILAGLVYAVSMLLRLIPRYARIVQMFFENVKGKVSQLADLLAEPFLRLRSMGAAAHYLAKLGRKEAQE